MSTFDAFISSGGKDREIAFRLVARLEADGLSCWIAPRNIDVGRPFQDELVRGIEHSDALVVLCSSTSLKSAHVNREVERADSKQKRILPIFIEDVEPTGPLSYYFGSLQRLLVAERTVEGYAKDVAELLHGKGAPREARSEGITADSLVALGRSICWDVREVLRRDVTPETRTIVNEPKPGMQVMMIDLEANRRARESVALWSTRHGASVFLTGEDLQDDEDANDSDVVVMLDALDGTQHWLRSRDLWCTALSVFSRDSAGEPHRLRVSMVQLADERLYYAREDTKTTFLDGDEQPLTVRASKTATLEDAHVCTVARRPGHFRVLQPLLASGSPFAGLYTFAGNPILVELVNRQYDAIFQPDASEENDPQQLWDWLPGGHILFRAGCIPRALDGTALDVVELANRGLQGAQVSAPFVAAPNDGLADALLAWLKPKTPSAN